MTDDEREAGKIEESTPEIELDDERWTAFDYPPEPWDKESDPTLAPGRPRRRFRMVSDGNEDLVVQTEPLRNGKRFKATGRPFSWGSIHLDSFHGFLVPINTAKTRYRFEISYRAYQPNLRSGTQRRCRTSDRRDAVIHWNFIFQGANGRILRPPISNVAPMTWRCNTSKTLNFPYDITLGAPSSLLDDITQVFISPSQPYFWLTLC